MLKEFKEFISKGNVLDMAVGVVVGGAFTAIVNSLVNDIIMPLVGILTGGINLADLSLNVGDAVFAYGSFLQNIVQFLIIAFSMFVVVKAINKMRSLAEDAAKKTGLKKEEKKEEKAE